MPVLIMAGAAAATTPKRRFNTMFKRTSRVHVEDAEMATSKTEAEGSAAEPGTSQQHAVLRQDSDSARAEVVQKRQKNDSLRRKIYNTFEDPAYSTPAKYLSIFMMFIILLSTVCFILESEAENPDGMLNEQPALVRTTRRVYRPMPPHRSSLCTAGHIQHH